MRVENVRARDYTRGRPGRPSHIVIHHWGVDGQTHDGVVAWFRNGNSRKTSAHYVERGPCYAHGGAGGHRAPLRRV